MELFERVCVKGPVSRSSETESELVEETVEEEFGDDMQYFEEDFYDYQDLGPDLKCLDQQLLVLQWHFRQKCDDENLTEDQMPLNCLEQEYVCALDKQMHHAQCQIDELLRTAMLAKDFLCDITENIDNQQYHLKNMQTDICDLKKVKSQTTFQPILCKDRYHYIKRIKISPKLVIPNLTKMRACYVQIQKKYLSKEAYIRQLMFFDYRMSELKSLYNDFQILHVAQFRKMGFRGRLSLRRSIERTKKFTYNKKRI